ncbi:sugar transporter-domain-containing protein [Nemania abortiva]|nr:sugar transporter-domain-containing protein [Nemania abortiva]
MSESDIAAGIEQFLPKSSAGNWPSILWLIFIRPPSSLTELQFFGWLPTSAFDMMVQHLDTEMNELNGDNKVSGSHNRINSTARQWSADLIANYNDHKLRRDAERFAVDYLKFDAKSDDFKKFVRAAFVARDIDIYYDVSHGNVTFAPGQLDVDLEEDEKEALRNEKDKLFNERGITMVNLAVSLAAMLQGHVQSSINGASLYADRLGIDQRQQWVLGAVNAAPFLTAAVLGCWLALPVNNHFGRRGGMIFSAVLIFFTSLVAALSVKLPVDDRWKLLLGARILNGIGMGVKAVSTPILASETAIRFWRGSFVLAWQLWVSFGIMIGFAFNLIFASVVQRVYPNTNHDLTVALILGAPLVFAVGMLGAVLRCTESPRYYMRGGQESQKYEPKKAYQMLQRLRSCKLLAMKDMYLLHKTIEQEIREINLGVRERSVFTKFGQLFTRRRLRNALVSTSVVNLAQQLCGINISAFYSGSFFIKILYGDGPADYHSIEIAMALSLGFGAVNFFFGLPAIKTIDTLGRRKWLTWTLPLMTFFLFAGAVSFPIPWDENRADGNTVRIVALWLYFHAAVYSPGLGPIPFTLASESFPLSHREIGCAFAIAVNLGFAGLLTLVFPALNENLHPPGSLGLFSGFTFIGFILVYLLVEETKELSLEHLSYVLNGSKRKFARYQVARVGWFVRRYGMGIRDEEPPELDNYVELEERNPGFEDPESGDRSLSSRSNGGSRVSSIRSISPRQTEGNPRR